jgi:hypothetical protein
MKKGPAVRPGLKFDSSGETSRLSHRTTRRAKRAVDNTKENSMRKTMLAIAITAAALTIARAEDAKPLTVEQAVGVGEGLRDLSTRKNDQGQRAPLPSGVVRLNGRVLMQLAIAQQQTDTVLRAYQEATQTSLKNAFGDESPTAVLADPKRAAEYQTKNAAFQESVKKALAAPSGVSVRTVTPADLCHEAAPPACPQANPISVETLTLLMPILDQGAGK